MRTGTVYGSHGHIEINLETGDVISIYHYSGSEGDYSDIVKFDIGEFKQAWPERVEAETFDILDIGYWTESGYYEAADTFHREQIRAEAMVVIASSSVGDLIGGTPNA